jgi:hypothetical protein
MNPAADTTTVRRGNTRADELSRLSFPPGAEITVLAYYDDIVIMCVTREGETEPQVHQWPPAHWGSAHGPIDVTQPVNAITTPTSGLACAHLDTSPTPAMPLPRRYFEIMASRKRKADEDLRGPDQSRPRTRADARADARAEHQQA